MSQHGLTTAPSVPCALGWPYGVVTEPSARLVPMNPSAAGHGAGRQGEGKVPAAILHVKKTYRPSTGCNHGLLCPGIQQKCYLSAILVRSALLKCPQSNECWQIWLLVHLECFFRVCQKTKPTGTLLPPDPGFFIYWNICFLWEKKKDGVF